MQFLTVFWIIAVFFYILFFLTKLLKLKKYELAIENNGFVIFIFLTALIIVAIATNDPITIAGIVIPTEIQWLGSLFVSGFGAWQFYLDPLKKKVYRMDRELGEINSSVSSIKTSVDKLLDKAMKK